MITEKDLSVVIEESEQETKVPLIFQIIVELVLGVFLIIYRDMTTNILFIVIGSLMVAYGLFDLIAFVTNNRPYSFRRGLTTGVLITIIGVAFIVQAEALQNLLSIIIGALILMESIINCRRAFIMKNLGSQNWFIVFIASLAIVALSIFICIYPNIFGEIISVIIGITVILVAIIDFVAIFRMSSMRNKLKRSGMYKEKTETAIIDVTPK